MIEWFRRLFRPAEVEFDPAWEQVLDAGFGHWSTFDASELDRMRKLIAGFVTRTRWEAARDFELTTEVKVLIAAQASVLLLGLEIDEYPGLRNVLVHRSTVRLRGQHATGAGTFSSAPRYISGQASDAGQVVLSWAAARRGAMRPEFGQNVVYHEFAHRLDMLDGLIDGTPPLESEQARARWARVCTAAYDEVRALGSPVLRPYAGTNPAEFFAVATEVFFNRPGDLRSHEPDLYTELVAFYGQDPAGRLAYGAPS